MSSHESSEIAPTDEPIELFRAWFAVPPAQAPDGREVVFVSWVYGRDRT